MYSAPVVGVRRVARRDELRGGRPGDREGGVVPAHAGFLTLEPHSDVLYQIAPAYTPGHEAGVRWDDPAFAIAWPTTPQLISARDASYPDHRG